MTLGVCIISHTFLHLNTKTVRLYICIYTCIHTRISHNVFYYTSIGQACHAAAGRECDRYVCTYVYACRLLTMPHLTQQHYTCVFIYVYIQHVCIYTCAYTSCFVESRACVYTYIYTCIHIYIHNTHTHDAPGKPLSLITNSDTGNIYAIEAHPGHAPASTSGYKYMYTIKTHPAHACARRS
jgi:hypothetical protein